MAKAISAGLAKQEDFNQAPPIPPVETPTEPTVPFGSAQPSASPSQSSDGVSLAPSFTMAGQKTPQQKVLEAGLGPVRLESPEAQKAIEKATPPAPLPTAEARPSVFVPGTEKFVTKAPAPAVGDTQKEAEKVAAGQKRASISADVLANPEVLEEVYGRDFVTDEALQNAQSVISKYEQTHENFNFAPADVQEALRIRKVGSEQRRARNEVRPTTSISNPVTDIFHHSRVLQQEANKITGGDVNKLMRQREQGIIAPSYLHTDDMKRQADILFRIEALSETAGDLLKKGDKNGSNQVVSEIEKLKKEYTSLSVKTQSAINMELQKLGMSDDPSDVRRRIALQNAKKVFFETEPEKRAKAAIEAVSIPTTDDLLFQGMSSQDIARLALHTKYMQLEQKLGSNWVQRLWNTTFDDDVEKLKEEIELLAPAVILNQSPITDFDAGFWKTAAKSFADEFGGSGTSVKKAQALEQTLGDIGAMRDVRSKAALRSAAAPYEKWSREELGSASGSSGAFMLEMIPATVATEGAFGVTGTARAASAIINSLKAAKKTKTAGRILNTIYEATKSGLAYEAAGKLYDEEDEMNFTTGFVGRAMGEWAEKKIEPLTRAVQTKLFGVFGNKAKDVSQKLIDYGKTIAGKGVKGAGTGFGETVEEFGEALGGIIEQSDTASQILDGIKQQFPDGSSALHFAAQSFIMGSGMGAGNIVGQSLYARARKLYNGLSADEKKKFDDFKATMDQQVNEAVKQQQEKDKAERKDSYFATDEDVTQPVVITKDNAAGSDNWLSDDQRQRLDELKALQQPTAEESAELAQLVQVEKNQVERDEMLGRRAEVGVTMDPFYDMPVQLVTVFDRVENEAPIDPVALNAASNWLYGRYKDIVAMKNDPQRMLSTEQINAYAQQLEEDITTLENYRNKLREQAEGVTETVTPTIDAVQEPTTAEVGAQPSRTEGPREEGGGGVRPGVEGTEAAQAGGAQAEVAPAAERQLESFQEASDSDADARVFSSLSIGSVLTDSSDPNNHFVVVGDTTSKRTGERRLQLAIVEKTSDGKWVGGPANMFVTIGKDGKLKSAPQIRGNFTKSDGTRGLFIMQPSNVSIPFLEVVQEDSETGETFTPGWVKDMPTRATPTQTTQPTPAAPAPTTEAATAATTEAVAAPKAETLKKMNTLADLEVKSDENQNKNKQTRASAKRKMDKMLAEDARLAEVNANFDKAVNDLEKAGKLKVRCP